MADYDRYGTSSRSDVYVPMPVDRAKVGEKKIEKLQEEIERLENDQRKRKELIEKLTRMQEVEDRRSKQQDVISERFTRRRDLLLNEEMERVYGQNSPRVSGKSPAQMMDNLLAQRNREFSMKQKEKELETKYLVQERERLQQARERVREQRRNLLSPAESAMSEPDYHYRTRDEASPTVRGTPELPRQQSAHSVNGYVKRTIKEMPKTMDRITQLRQEVQKHYNVYVRPYRGEMGIHTYQPWQLKDYAMCRDIVESVVNEFLDLHFEEAIPMVEKETYYAIVDQRQREKEKNKETLSERRALQLEMEDILQEVTGEMALEVGKENRHTHGTVRNMTDLLMMNRAEAVVIDNEKGREINDPAYNVVTKHFYTTQTERDSTRNGIFYHSLDLELKQPGVPPVHRKKLPAQDQRLDTTKSKGKPPTRKQTPKKEPDVPGSQPKPPGPAPIVAPISVKEDPDVVVLEYHPIIPVDIRIYEPLITDLPDVKVMKMHYQTYQEKEVSYWHHMVPYIWELQLPNRCKGVNIVSASPCSRYMAFGSYQGEVFIYDASTEPWRPIKFILNSNNNDDAITNISWSLDSTRVITITYSGALNIWSLFNENFKVSVARSIGMPRDRSGAYPQDAKLMLDMDSSLKDFTFKDGQLADEGALDTVSFPSYAAWFPSFSLLGVQNSFVVGLENGDILKCDIEFATSPPSDDKDAQFLESHRVLNPLLTHGRNSTNLNEIGQGTEAELMRQHKAKIIYLGFIDNINDMLSVDEEGYIFKWKYNRENLANIGWFKPYKKLRLSPHKDMYEPTEGKAKLIFTDKNNVPNKRTRTRQEIASEREQMSIKIGTLQLGDPWHTVENDDGIVTNIFAPKQGVKDTGAVFHIIDRYKKTNQLATYVTRVYRPVKIQYSKMAVLKSQDGNELIFFLLFPSYPPKEPHITVIVFDVKTEELRDFRRDWYLSEAEFTELRDKDMNFADITRVFGPTGSEYLFLTILGNVRAISLTTGRQLVRMEDSDTEIPGYHGCIINRSEIELLENAQVATLCTRGKIFALFFAPRSNRIYGIEFEDENQSNRRRAMWKYYQRLDNQRQRLMPVELRVDHKRYEFDDKQHASVSAMAIILDCMDKAIQRSHRAKFNAKQREDFMLWDREMNYKPIEKEIQNNTLLTGL